MKTKPKYTPPNFDELGVVERRLRGRLGTLIRMKERREGSIKELKRKIETYKKEIEGIEEELNSLLKGNTEVFQFPKFRIEEYFNVRKDKEEGEEGKEKKTDKKKIVGDKTDPNFVMRVVWSTYPERLSFILGMSKNILNVVRVIYPDIDRMKIEERDEKVLEVMGDVVKVKYWKKQYLGFKGKG